MEKTFWSQISLPKVFLYLVTASDDTKVDVIYKVSKHCTKLHLDKISSGSNSPYKLCT